MVRSDIVKMYKGIHTWVGIISGLFLFIAFYAGAITMFETPLQRWATPPTQLAPPPSLADTPKLIEKVLAAHPEGLVVGDIASELDIASSTLSHHLEKLRNEELVSVRREGTFLRYSANNTALQELLGFLYAECCTRNKAIKPEAILCC